jgi:hypothetical protein
MSEFKAKLNPFTGQLQLIPTNIVLAFKAGVATQANLPLVLNAKGDARIANDSGHLYVWSIEAATGLLTDWVDAGDIVDLEWSAISGKPSSAVADIDDAVSKKHTQGTDQVLDTGGANEISAANAKAAYTHSGVVTGNPHAVSKSDVGLGNVDNVSEATIISDVKADSDVADAISKKHTASGQFNQAIAAEISALADKETPVNDDVFLAEDSATGTPFGKIKIRWEKIKETLKSYFDGLYDAIGAATAAINGHKDLTTGVHGVGAGTIAKTADITKSAVGLDNVTNDAQLKSSQLVKGTFVDGDLVAGVLTITHNLGLVTNFSVLITIIDDNDKVIIPDEIACLTNTTTVDLTSYGTLTGTWKYILLG